MNKNNKTIMVNHLCLTDKSNGSKKQSTGLGWSSKNWSGYTVTGRRGAYNRVSGEWIVPTVRATQSPTFSSAWIGIDGFKNSSLIQVGTGHEFVNGNAQYYAWWEILPAVETVIPHSVNPGDRIKATITKVGYSKWSITMRNLTRNWTFRTLQRYTGPQTSAEWIMEAPEVDGIIAKLACVSPTVFSNCRVNGRSPKLMLPMGGIMVQNHITVAIPTPPNKRGDAFSVKRVYIR